MPPMESHVELEALLGQAHWLRALAVSLLGSRPDAEDAVQEVWRAALRSPPDRERPARPWLAQVLRNVVRSHARHTGRRRAHEAEAAALGGPAEAPAADGVLERMQLHRRVAELVMALEEPYRMTLLLRFYEGRAAVDIAREAGVPEGTARWRISEGVRRLRERLDQEPGGRQRWAGLLAPLAAPSQTPSSGPAAAAGVGRLSLWLGAAAVTCVLGAGAVWLVGAHRPGVAGSHRAGESGHLHGFFHDERTTGPGRSESEDETMRHERLKQAAVFFGAVLPALAAGAGQAEEDRKLEEVAVAACVELNEKSYECREEFVDAFLDLQLAHSKKKMTAEERATQREKDLRDLTERGSGPIERKRAICQRMISQMGVRAKEAVKSVSPPLKSCYSKDSCKERVACIMPIIAEIHGSDARHPKH